ncbi:MAG: cobalamin-dependent protein [Ktedonobacteraceae bacterium]
MTVQGKSIERPDLELYSDTPMFNTKAVVQQTGVAAPTLRAWERRYTLLAPERAGNAYRLYTERDVVMIRWLKERVDAGMSISQAIALFHQKNDEHLTQSESTSTIASDVVPLRNGHTLSSGSRDWQRSDASYIQNAFPTVYSMRLARERLIEAFNQLDGSIGSMIMGSMLAIYPLEQICTELITPTMWQIGQLWADGMITVSVEHFASNFFRALLTNLFHVTPSITNGPIAIVCCAPGEPHELAPLMLSLFLQRNGIRVVYLGQNIEVEGLLQTIRKLAPALLCVSVTMPAYLSAVIDLAHQLEEQPDPRPIFAFGGQVFTRHVNIIAQIPGVYLAGDLKTIVAQLRTMIVERLENKS